MVCVPKFSRLCFLPGQAKANSREKLCILTMEKAQERCLRGVQGLPKGAD